MGWLQACTLDFLKLITFVQEVGESVCVCVHVHMCAWVHACVRACVAGASVCLCVCMRACVCICVHVLTIGCLSCLQGY